MLHLLITPIIAQEILFTRKGKTKSDRYITICMSALPLPLFPLIYAAFALFMRGMDML